MQDHDQDIQNEYIEPRPRPKVTEGITVCRNTACGHLYVTLNSDDEGLCEVFATLGKSGGCPKAMLEATTRLSSVMLRCWINPEVIVKQLRGIRCPYTSFDGGSALLSCPDAIAQTIEEYVYGIALKKG